MHPLVRPVLAGLATGARSMSSLAVCANTSSGSGAVDRALHRGPVARATAWAAVVELVGDKLPIAPARTELPGLTARLALGMLTGAVVTTRSGYPPASGAAAGAGAAVVTTIAGPRVRALAAARYGSDLPGALAEDALAYVLAFTAARRHP